MRVLSSSHVASVPPSSSRARLLILFLCSSMESLLHETSSMNFSNMSPSHWLQFFINCSSSPFQRVQFLRDSLLQHGAPVRSQILSANLPQHGLLLCCSSCQEPAPEWSSHRVTASCRHPPALVWSPP